jgi:hypothetical protein
LAGIKQLGSSYVVYRGAIHTRFEHSLGTLHAAEKMVQAARRNPASDLSPRETIPIAAHRLVRLGALLHDVTHIPFGHTLEDEFGLLRRHDTNLYRFRAFFEREKSQLRQVLIRAIGEAEYRTLLAVLRAHEEREIQKLEYPFVADIIGNTVCADLLDYVRRDLEACGMSASVGERFLDYLTVTSQNEPLSKHRRRMALHLDKRGMPRPDVESEVVKLLAFRYELAERVYFHHSKNAASVMIGRAVQSLQLASGPAPSPDGGQTKWEMKQDKRFHWLTDEMLLRLLIDPRVASGLRIQLPRATRKEKRLARELAEAVLDRRLYKLIFLAVWDDLEHRIENVFEHYGLPDQRAALEDRLAADADLNPGEVLVHLPRSKMMSKPADVRVVTSDDTIITLTEWDELHSRRIDALNTAHKRLWRLAVYAHPSISSDVRARRLLQAAAYEVFQVPNRYQVERETYPYPEAVWDVHAGDRRWPSGLRDKAIREAAALRASGLGPILAQYEQVVRQETENGPSPEGEGPARL